MRRRADRPPWRRPPPRSPRPKCCSSEIGRRPAVFRVAILQPRPEFGVVLLALLAAVAERVVTEIEEPPPLRRAIRRRAMRRVAAENRDVARSELENDAGRQVDRPVRQLVVV